MAVYRILLTTKNSRSVNSRNNTCEIRRMLVMPSNANAILLAKLNSRRRISKFFSDERYCSIILERASLYCLMQGSPIQIWIEKLWVLAASRVLVMARFWIWLGVRSVYLATFTVLGLYKREFVPKNHRYRWHHTTNPIRRFSFNVAIP